MLLISVCFCEEIRKKYQHFLDEKVFYLGLCEWLTFILGNQVMEGEDFRPTIEDSSTKVYSHVYSST